MTRLLTGSIGLALLLTLTATAAGPPGGRAAAPDQIDYVFFATGRPVLIRLYVRNGDKPYDAPWTDWMNRMFAWFDFNNDGVLDGKEAGRVATTNALSSLMSGGISGSIPSPIQLTAVDANRDGKVTKDEFRAYYSKNALGALRFVQQNSEAATAQQINDTIYKRLDTNGDGRLNKEEMNRLPTALRSLDENEDEILGREELTTGTAADGYPAATGGVQPGPQTRTETGGLVPYQAGKPDGSLAARLIGFYGRNRAGKLSRKEIALEEKTFARLDANRDGLLDAPELSHLFTGDPDLVFKTQVGQPTRISGLLDRLGLGSSRTVRRIEDFDAKKRTPAMAKKVTRTDGDTMSLTLGDAKIAFNVQGGMTNTFLGSRNFYIQQFDLVAGKKGVVDREQQKENANNPFVFALFTQGDRDGDGKLTRKELVGWLDLVSSGSNVNVNLTVYDQGRSLFNVISASGDNRLSQRQMRTAWSRMGPLCKGRTAGLAREDLPRALRITLSQGNTLSRPVPAVVVGAAPAPFRSPFFGQAPEWFRKMDRNGDGDVSPKEWLGTEEDFRAVDADGDELISPEEARRFETKKGKK